MRAEDTLQFMMDFHSTLYHSRKDCLNQLFCVIGNGYEWINGELVEMEPDTKEILSRWKLVKPIEHAEPTEICKEMGKLDEQLKAIRAKAKPLAPEIEKYHSKGWYPLSRRFSYLFNYPQDIKPDWEKLRQECWEMLKNDGLEPDEVG